MTTGLQELKEKDRRRQKDIQGSFPRELADDCDDPGTFKTLAGFADVFPHKEQAEVLPRVANP